MAFLKRVALRLFHTAGVLNAVRFRYRHGLRILMYHRFPGDKATLEEQLARQCIHLKENYRILSLTEASRYLLDGKPFPLNALVLTVDDGHRDLHHPAFGFGRADRTLRDRKYDQRNDARRTGAGDWSARR